MRQKFIVAIVFIIFICGSVVLYGDIGGKSGRTLKTTSAGCGSCHGSSANSGVSVRIDGPDTISVGQTSQYSLTVSMTGKTGAGFDIAKRSGTLTPVSPNTHILNSEIVHSTNIGMTSGSATIQFNYTAPSTEAIDTIWATGLATNSSGGTGGDNWNWAQSKRIVVQLPSGINNVSTAGEFSLGQNYPNPFNPATNIEIDLLKPMVVKIKIMDVLGNEVALLNEGKLEQGQHIIKWNAANYPSGIYYYDVEGDNFNLTKKMILLK
jgi:Secretion system C-terminal sorting domain